MGFDKECGAKGDQWKGPGKVAMGEKWDCCMKNETMKNGTHMMGKDEWDQFDKTKDEWNKMTDQEKQAFKDSFRKKHEDKFDNVLEQGKLKPKRKQCRCGKPGEGKPAGMGGQGKPGSMGKPEGQGKPNGRPEKTSTRDGHSVSEKENQMLKPEHGKGGNPKEYTEAEFKEHLKSKIAKKLENIKTCNTQIDEIKPSEWS